MKIGLISDIHGNILALDKVLEEFKNRGVVQILCGGDMIGLGPHSEEVIQKLISCHHIVCIQGNHEGYFTNKIPEFIHGRPIREIEVKHHNWVQNSLSKESKEYIKSLANEKMFEIDGIKVYMAHYPFAKEGEYKQFLKVASEQELIELFQDVDADVYLYGHTHVQNIKKIQDKWYVNMGSLGCPLKENNLVAGVLKIENKEVSIEPIIMPYDASSVREEMCQMGYPFYEEVLEKFF